MERVYQNDMYLELKAQGFEVEAQKQIKVYYKNQLVGDFYADLVIENTIIVELKACRCIEDSHIAQLMNYLKSTRAEVGLLLNFGENAEFKRLIYTNNRKETKNQL